MLPGSSPITRSSPSSKAFQKSGSFPPPALPGFIGTTAPSDSHRSRRPKSASRSLPSPRWVSPVSRITFPTCCAHYPGGSNGCSCRLLPPSVQPSPLCRRVGIRDFTFEACSGFTRVTARRVARPPKAAFVTRLRSSQLPNRTARQLPDLSTTIWVDSSSTGYPCLFGAHCMIWVSKIPIGGASFRDKVRNSYRLSRRPVRVKREREVHTRLRLRHSISDGYQRLADPVCCRIARFLVAFPPHEDLLLRAKHLFVAAMVRFPLPWAQR